MPIQFAALAVDASEYLTLPVSVRLIALAVDAQAPTRAPVYKLDNISSDLGVFVTLSYGVYQPTHAPPIELWNVPNAQNCPEGDSCSDSLRRAALLLGARAPLNLRTRKHALSSAP